METKTKVNNRITQLFQQKKAGVLNIYFTAGFPNLEDTAQIIKSLEVAGADMVEIGMPFSDPLADGPTIQQSNEAALRNGMNMKKLFEQLKDIRKEVKIPLLLMGYLNPVMQYGVEDFCKKANELGVDGIILPDLPIEEYIETYKGLFESYNLSNIFLVAPNTSAERLKKIDQNSSGFIYIVSTDSTTGNTKDITQAEGYFKKIQSSGLNNPTLIGFNINDHKSFNFACNYANGAIIGSAFIKALKEAKELKGSISNFVSSIKKS
ncbi:MAG: tryptophan synthase subunit alpha [Cytophagaceae bacterium]|nr:tryptophan synthase subunit alpha [Cytophagaceae bacterium]